MVSEMEDIKIAVIGLGKQFLDSIKGVARGGIRCGRVRETK